MNIAYLESNKFSFQNVESFCRSYESLSLDGFEYETSLAELDQEGYDICLIPLSEDGPWESLVHHAFYYATPFFICDNELFKRKLHKNYESMAHQILSVDDFNSGLLEAFFNIFLVRFKLEKAISKLESRSFGHHEQSLMSLGQATAGVTHEVNNIMQSLGLSIDLALRKYSKGKDISPLLESLNSLASRGQKVTRQILDLAREESTTLEVVNVKEFISNLEPLLKMNITGGNTFEVSNLEWPYFAYLDESKMTFSLVNLVKNANDASDNSKVKLEVHITDNICNIDVVDSGSGISEEDMDHIFEPFFTTKGAGKGTGLGLPYVQKVAAEHNGKLSVISTVGEGTCFRFQVPITEDSSDSNGDGANERATKRFLIVDDQEDLTDVLKMIIEDEGHQVADFYCPVSALEYFENFSDLIDVVICDFNMPEMNGHELIQKMKEVKSDKIKYIISSGDPFLPVEIPEDVKVLGKPFNVEELYQLVFEND